MLESCSFALKEMAIKSLKLSFDWWKSKIDTLCNPEAYHE